MRVIHPLSLILLPFTRRGSSVAEQTAHNRWVESSNLSPATRSKSKAIPNGIAFHIHRRKHSPIVFAVGKRTRFSITKIAVIFKEKSLTL